MKLSSSGSTSSPTSFSVLLSGVDRAPLKLKCVRSTKASRLRTQKHAHTNNNANNNENAQNNTSRPLPTFSTSSHTHTFISPHSPSLLSVAPPSDSPCSLEPLVPLSRSAGPSAHAENQAATEIGQVQQHPNSASSTSQSSTFQPLSFSFSSDSNTALPDSRSISHSISHSISNSKSSHSNSSSPLLDRSSASHSYSCDVLPHACESVYSFPPSPPPPSSPSLSFCSANALPPPPHPPPPQTHHLQMPSGNTIQPLALPSTLLNTSTASHTHTHTLSFSSSSSSSSSHAQVRHIFQAPRTSNSHKSNSHKSMHTSNATSTSSSSAPRALSRSERAILEDVSLIQDWLSTIRHSKNPLQFRHLLARMKKTIFTPAQVKKSRQQQATADEEKKSTVTKSISTSTSTSSFTHRSIGRIHPRMAHFRITSQVHFDLMSTIPSHASDSNDNNKSSDGNHSTTHDQNNNDEIDDSLFDHVDSNELDQKLTSYMKKTTLQDDNTLLNKLGQNFNNTNTGVVFENGRWIVKPASHSSHNTHPTTSLAVTTNLNSHPSKLSIHKLYNDSVDMSGDNNPLSPAHQSNHLDEDELDGIPDFSESSQSTNSHTFAYRNHSTKQLALSPPFCDDRESNSPHSPNSHKRSYSASSNSISHLTSTPSHHGLTAGPHHVRRRSASTSLTGAHLPSVQGRIRSSSNATRLERSMSAAGQIQSTVSLDDNFDSFSTSMRTDSPSRAYSMSLVSRNYCDDRFEDSQLDMDDQSFTPQSHSLPAHTIHIKPRSDSLRDECDLDSIPDFDDSQQELRPFPFAQHPPAQTSTSSASAATSASASILRASPPNNSSSSSSTSSVGPTLISFSAWSAMGRPTNVVHDRQLFERAGAPAPTPVTIQVPPTIQNKANEKADLNSSFSGNSNSEISDKGHSSNLSEFPDELDIDDDIEDWKILTPSSTKNNNINSLVSPRQLISQPHRSNSSGSSFNFSPSSTSSSSSSSRTKFVKVQHNTEFPDNLDDLEVEFTDQHTNTHNQTPAVPQAQQGPAARELHEFDLTPSLLSSFSSSVSTHELAFAGLLSHTAHHAYLRTDPFTPELRARITPFNVHNVHGGNTKEHSRSRSKRSYHSNMKSSSRR